MGDVDPKQRFFRVGEAARKIGISCDQLRRLADRGQIPIVWRGSQRLFPVHSTLAYAQRNDPKKGDGAELDALAFGMIREGRTDEEIVTALHVPLERVERLRAPLAKTRESAARSQLEVDERDARERTTRSRSLREARESRLEKLGRLILPSKMRA